jgi:hypothetical protein
MTGSCFSPRNSKPIPALRIEVGFVHEIRHAVQQRREDAVRCPGHPAGIGGAPENVLVVKIEHVFSQERGTDIRT